MSTRNLALIALLLCCFALCFEVHSASAQDLPQEPSLLEPAAAPVQPMNRASADGHLVLAIERARGDLGATFPDDGLTLHARPAAEAEGLKLCPPPCSANLRKGRYEFGAGFPGREPVWSGRTFDLKADEHLTVSYERKYRGLGVLPLIAGPLIAGMIFVASHLHDGDLDGPGRGGLAAARAGEAIAFFGGISLGVWMLSRKDEVTVRVAGRAGAAIIPKPVVEELVLLTEPEIVRRVFACTEDSVREVDVSVDADPSSKVIAARVPQTLGRGARRCIRQVFMGRTIDDGDAATRRLVIRRPAAGADEGEV